MVAMSLLAINGCSPSDSSQLDDEKEPHFVLGKSRVNAMDYSGAVEAFGESLEVNPHSAAAHFQLACLFDTKQSDPAAAIYHYQEFLRLNPKADNADIVRQRIYSCKQQLATDVGSLPSSPAAQRQLEFLTETNRLLQSQITQLQAELDKWRSYYSTKQNTSRIDAPPPPANFAGYGTPLGPPPDDVSAQGANNAGISQQRAQTTRITKPRTHIVAAGETLALIARNAGVSLTALQAANPGVTPKKLKPGQTLNLPGQ
jgi:LysM repeat protein